MKTKFRFHLTVAFFISLSYVSFGQKNYWIEYNNNNFINKNKNFKERLEIDKSNSIINIENKIDDLQISHSRYKQYAKGYPVEGVSFIRHKYPNGKQLVNGLWIKNFTPKIDFQIVSESTAIKSIEKHFGKTRQIAFNNLNGNKPKLELVWYDNKYRKEAKYYRLAYKVNVIVSSPYEHYNVFVDARTGLVFHKYKSLNCANHPAKGVGFYTGDTVSFVVDSIDVNNYQMKESSRNNSVSITTQDASKNNQVIASNDNVWKDKAAVDSHWGAEKTIDYYYEYHGRNSLDDKGLGIIVNVHALDPWTGGPMANAYWDGFSSSINIGDGDPNTALTKPLSSLEIIAHELTHGLTQFSANLNYEGESGAINESVSDMFGITIEQLNYKEYNWELGDLFGYVIRRMNDPKSLNMPAFYKGQFWEDDADVHDNSSIGNLWYYYLVEGGKDINERGDSFNLEGLGFEKAAQIVYRSLTVYLTQSSDYPEFQSVSIKAAEDLFGVCSQEAKSVSIAWQAVGVGDPITDNDFKSTRLNDFGSGCGFGIEEIRASVTYASCGSNIPPGTIITFNYSVNADSIVSEDYEVQEEIKGGDTINYLFTQKADLSQLGDYKIKTWVYYELDEYHTNDTAVVEFENRLQQNEDFKIVDFSENQSFKFCGKEIEGFDIRLQFLGCDGLDKGTQIPIIATLDNSLLETSVTLTEDIFYFDTINLHIEGLLYVDDFGEYPLEVRVEFPQDTFTKNNEKSIITNFVATQIEDSEYKFDDIEESDNFIIYTGKDIPKDTILERYPGNNQDKVILFEGGEVFNSWLQYIVDIPEKEDDIWIMNPSYESKMCKCIDARDREDLFMSFDYNIGQSLSWDYDYPPSYEAPNLFSAMRILVDDSAITGNYFRNYNFDNKEINLSQFVGKEFLLCFQMKTLLGKSSMASFGYYGDFVKIDNVKFYSRVGFDEELYRDYNITLQPNPVNDLLTINLNNNHDSDISFEVFDISGKRVFYKEENFKNGENSRKFDFSFLKPGFYVLKTKEKKSGKFTSNRFVKI